MSDRKGAESAGTPKPGTDTNAEIPLKSLEQLFLAIVGGPGGPFPDMPLESASMPSGGGHSLDALSSSAAAAPGPESNNNGQVKLYTRMLHACMCGNRPDLAPRLVMEFGADPTAHFESLTALHRAAGEGFLELVKFFIQSCGVDPLIGDSSGMPPLLYASRFPDIVKYFVEEHDMNPVKKYGSYGSLLDRAIHDKCRGTIVYVVMEYRAPLSRPLDVILLEFAVTEGVIPLLKFLVLDAKVSPRHIKPRDTMLQHMGVITFLFEQLGLSVDEIIDDSGFNFVHLAALKGHHPALQYFLETLNVSPQILCKFKQATLLHLACGGGSLQNVEYLVEKWNSDLYKCDSEGCPPVLWASIHPEVTEFVLNHKRFDINHQYSAGTFLIQKAAAAGMLSLTKALVPRCSNRSLLEKSLSGAILYGQLETTRFLHDDCGVPVATLRWVASTLPMAKYFLEEKGLNPTSECIFGWTLFLSACLSGTVEVISILLRRKTSIPIAQLVLGVMLLIGRDNCTNAIQDLYELIPQPTRPIPVEAITLISANNEIRTKYVQTAIAVITHELDLEAAVMKYLTDARVMSMQQHAMAVATQPSAAAQTTQRSQLPQLATTAPVAQRPQRFISKHPPPALLDAMLFAAAHGDLGVIQYLVELCGVDPTIRIDSRYK